MQLSKKKLFSQGTNKSLLEVQREPGMKSSKLTKPEVEATVERIQSNFEDLRKNPDNAITDGPSKFARRMMDFCPVGSKRIKKS